MSRGTIGKKVPRVATIHGEPMLNPAGLIRWFWDMTPEELPDVRVRERVGSWQERVRGVQRACLNMGRPISIDDLLWEHGNGEKLKRAISDSLDRKVPLPVGELLDIIFEL